MAPFFRCIEIGKDLESRHRTPIVSVEMTYQEAVAALHLRKLHPVYLIYGEEPYFIRHLIDLFRKQVSDPAAYDFSYNPFQGETVRPATLINLARTEPVKTGHRLILIHDADRIKDDKGLLPVYLEKPHPHTVMVFVTGKPDFRKKLFSTLQKRGISIDCAPLPKKEVSAWIQKEGEKEGLHFSEEALSCLSELAGGDIFFIRRAIDKLLLYLGEEKEVTLNRLHQVTSGGKSYTAFEWVDAVVEKRLPDALSGLLSVLSEGGAPLALLGLLSRQFRIMAVAQEEMDLGIDIALVGRKLPMPPPYRAAFFKRLSHWKSDEIQTVFGQLGSADSHLKGGRLSAGLVMELLVLDLCRQKEGKCPNYLPDKLT